jgi:hypothetical protein
LLGSNDETDGYLYRKPAQSRSRRPMRTTWRRSTRRTSWAGARAVATSTSAAKNLDEDDDDEDEDGDFVDGDEDKMEE